MRGRGACTPRPRRRLVGGACVKTYRTRVIGVAPCSIEGCEAVVFARGWCSRHYTRWTRHGDPTGGRPDTRAERFWQKVDRRGNEQCWIWISVRNSDGYGQFRTGGAFMDKAHRESWRMANGPIPEGLSVLHRCDNPSCVNPNHLFLGTQQDNIADMLRKGRHVKRGQKVAP